MQKLRFSTFLFLSFVGFQAWSATYVLECPRSLAKEASYKTAKISETYSVVVGYELRSAQAAQKILKNCSPESITFDGPADAAKEARSRKMADDYKNGKLSATDFLNELVPDNKTNEGEYLADRAEQIQKAEYANAKYGKGSSATTKKSSTSGR